MNSRSKWSPAEFWTSSAREPYFDLVALNRAIGLLLEERSTHPFKNGRSESRQDLFLSQEKAALSPLPSTRYISWHDGRRPIDYRVEVDRRIDSIPMV